MSHFFSGGSLRIEPEIMSTIQNDYWEEFTKVNESFVHEPDIVIRKLNKTPRIYSQKNINQQHVQNNGGPEVHELSIRRPSTKVYPQLPSDKVGVDNKCFENDFVPEKYIEFRSVAVQTDGNYDDEPEVRSQFIFILSYSYLLIIIYFSCLINAVAAFVLQLHVWFGYL